MHKHEAEAALAEGELIGCQAVALRRRHGWHLKLHLAEGDPVLLEDAQGQPKWFGKLSTIAAMAKQIGFTSMNVHLSGLSD